MDQNKKNYLFFIQEKRKHIIHLNWPGAYIWQLVLQERSCVQ